MLASVLVLLVAASEEPTIGITAMGEWYPKLGAQQSVLTGARIHIGLLESIFVVIEGGYSAAGNVPGDGDDGIMLGAGVEASTALVDQILELVVRATIDVRIVQTTDQASGTLSAIGAMLASGLRLVRLVELHLLGGYGFHGAFGVGLGAAVGFFF